jgi:hypothetical protein
VDDNSKRARREHEFADQIRKHGGSGFRPDVPIDDSEAVIQATHGGLCLLCGGRWGPLHLHIPRHYPDLGKDEARKAYRAQFKIPDAVPLSATWYLEARDRGRSEFLADKERSGEYRQGAAQKSAGPKPHLYSKTGVDPSGWDPSNWEIAKRLCSGIGQAETAKHLGGGSNHKLVGRRAEPMDLALGASFVCDCGQPLTNGQLFELREISGFEVADFDRYVGLAEGRSSATRPTDSLVNPEDAQAVIAWRDSVISELRRVSASEHLGLKLHGTRVYSQERVLKTLLPSLGALNTALIGTMGKIRETLRANLDWSVGELGRWIGKEAAIEHSFSQDTRWRLTLRYLARREEFPTENLPRLRAPNENDGELAREAIGHGANHYTVQNALRQDTEIIPKFELRLLIERFAPKLARPKPSPGGAPPGPREMTSLRNEMAAISELLGNRQKEVAEDFLFGGKTAEDRMNKTFDYFSHHRPEIDSLKTELQGITPEDLSQRFSRCRARLSDLITRKKHR